MAVQGMHALNPQLRWLFDFLSFFESEEITVPVDFHTQVKCVKEVLRSDISGLVNSMLDFGINSAAVNYNIETESKELNDIIKYWLDNINISMLGRVPTGIKALSKEYYRERWKNSSLIVMRTVWEDVEISGTKFKLPTKMWLVDGGNVKVENEEKDVRIIGTEKYSLRITDKKFKSLPSNKDEKIFIQKPFDSWSCLYSTPFMIQRGLYKNLKMYDLISKKGEKVTGKALEYLLLLKKGSEQMAVQGNPDYTYTTDELKEIKKNFKEMVRDSKTEAGTPTYVSNFDTSLEHLIPEYTRVLNAGLYENVEKRLLAGLGLVDIVEGTSSSRRESILNPKPFIAETENGIDDFMSILTDVITTIKQENVDKHRKYMNSDIQLHRPQIKQFITDSLRDHFRSMYDRGVLSKRTYNELIGDFDLDIEVKRRDQESKDKLDIRLYPPVVDNREGTGIDFPEDTNKSPKLVNLIPKEKKQSTKNNENKPTSKTGPEAKNFKSNV
jgi:hypothetical protein